jgi:Glucose/sorbosone dehydrogenases
VAARAGFHCRLRLRQRTRLRSSDRHPAGALQQVAAGLNFPLYLTAPPGDTGRLFIAEKGGAIRIVKHGTLEPTPFLDLNGKVSTGAEQGLLGLAFDPAFATNGRFVVHYTDVSGNTTISLFQVATTNPDSADPASERIILTVEQPFPNHNGGQLVFGPDGMLYIGWVTAAARAIPADGASR